MFDWYLKVVRDNYANFKGRARRKEFWYFALVNMIIGLILKFADNMLGTTTDGEGILGAIYSLIVLVPSIAVGVRRLHDVGKSGWFWLLWFIPIIGWIILLVWNCTDSEPGENQWGKNPKGIGNLDDINTIGRE